MQTNTPAFKRYVKELDEFEQVAKTCKVPLKVGDPCYAHGNQALRFCIVEKVGTKLIRVKFSINKGTKTKPDIETHHFSRYRPDLDYDVKDEGGWIKNRPGNRVVHASCYNFKHAPMELGIQKEVTPEQMKEIAEPYKYKLKSGHEIIL